jgi:hypothetical protein
MRLNLVRVGEGGRSLVADDGRDGGLGLRFQRLSMFPEPRKEGVIGSRGPTVAAVAGAGPPRVGLGTDSGSAVENGLCC